MFKIYNFRKKLLCICLLLVTLLSLLSNLCVNYKEDFPATQKTLSSLPPKSEEKVVKILGWTTFEGKTFDQLWSHSCPGCEIISNRSEIQSASAVVFHWGDWGWSQWRDVPLIRYPGQFYVFYHMESPPHTNGNLNEIRNFFNLTMSYMKDADIYNPYGTFVQNPKMNLIEDLSQIVAKKSKLAAWMVSNCRTHSQREEIVAKLQQHMQVDIFGDCGNNQKCTKAVRTECDTMLETHYFFYLSFENSNCPDYITEKLFERLSVVIVPIVLIRKIYEQIAPANSFMAVDDFTTIEQLANYLKYLSTNHTAYQDYLQWRTDWKSVCYPHNQGVCNLCTFLHQTSMTFKSYANLNGFVHRGQCSNDRLMTYSN